MRIRDIARIDGFPCGEYNAVTDVKGVRVGHSTVIKDGAGPVEGIARTGVTVVLPAGDIVENAMYAGVFSLNGNGELSGCHWIEESGLLTTPIALTNTHSLGHRARRHDRLLRPPPEDRRLLVLDASGRGRNVGRLAFRHQRDARAARAFVRRARFGGVRPVAEGCVGGGTA